MELKLDESKIRKGKPVGLPYVGSKKKISKKIVEIIKQNFGTEKTVYDLFGGGGAVTFECLINGLDVVYNDIDPLVGEAIQLVLNEDRDFIKEIIISRDEFYAVKLKENKTAEDKLKLLSNSFGNNEIDYLYSKKYSDLKYVLAREIVEKHDCFNRYKQTSTFKEAKDNITQLQQLQMAQQLERLQQLERSEVISRVQSLDIKNDFEFNSKDYRDFSNVVDSVIYLDPVYNDITRKRYGVDNFDYDSFYEWCIEMSKDNIVLVSEYSMPKEFECVFEFTKARPTIQQGGKHKKYEKLFMVQNNLDRILHE